MNWSFGKKKETMKKNGFANLNDLLKGFIGQTTLPHTVSIMKNNKKNITNAKQLETIHICKESY